MAVRALAGSNGTGCSRPDRQCVADVFDSRTNLGPIEWNASGLRGQLVDITGKDTAGFDESSFHRRTGPCGVDHQGKSDGLICLRGGAPSGWAQVGGVPGDEALDIWGPRLVGQCAWGSDRRGKQATGTGCVGD